MKIKVLSVRNPEAWLIAHGYKDIENRSWSTKHRGPLAIHAGKKKMTKADRVWFADECEYLGIEYPTEIHYGGIVGIVSMVDVVTDHDSRWFEPQPDNYGWVFKRFALTEFVPMNGRLGLFEIDADLIKIL